MRIRIEMSKKEKEVIVKALGLEENLKFDYKEIEESNCGTIHYDPNAEEDTTVVEFDFKSVFIEDLAGIVESIKDILKGVVKMFKSFSNRWFGDSIVKTYDENGEEIVCVIDKDGNKSYVKASEVE